MTFSELVESKGFSYRNLATSSYLSVQQVYNYASGKVRPEKASFYSVWNLSQQLEVDPNIVYQAIVDSWRERLQK